MLELNKIYNMDCLEGMKELNENSIDLIVSDPPYFLPVQSYVGTRKEGYSKRHIADTSILKGYFERIFEEMDRVLKPEGSFYIFCDAQSYPIFYQVMFPYCKHTRLIIWDKMVSYNGYTWRHQHELIAWGERQETKRVPTGDGDIIKCRGVLQKNRKHPAEKPVEIIEKLILKSSNEGDIVLDTFIGSGTTALACKNTNRNYIGFELDTAYCDIANKRLLDIV